MIKIKEIFKKNKYILNVYRKTVSLFNATLITLSPKIATKFIYRIRTGKKLNLKSPSHFNEKIQWLKLHWQHPLVAKCGDKYEVRNYAKDKGYEDILIDIYGIYEDASDIDWEALPKRFVLKVTNASGFNIICTDKSKLDREIVINQLNNWLKFDYSLKTGELHYAKMKSRIICEKFIETDQGSLPVDYKIYCFNGEPKYILVTPEREKGFQRLFFDLNWNKVDFEKEPTNSGTVKKPKSFDRMIESARELSKPFPFVRVDYYDNKGKAILGEMTFTPAGGLATHYSEEFSKKMGDMIELPVKIISS